MAKKAVFQKVMLESPKGYRYYVKINPRTQEEKLELRKYCPYERKHVVFKQRKLPPHKKQ